MTDPYEELRYSAVVLLVFEHPFGPELGMRGAAAVCFGLWPELGMRGAARLFCGFVALDCFHVKYAGA